MGAKGVSDIVSTLAHYCEFGIKISAISGLDRREQGDEVGLINEQQGLLCRLAHDEAQVVSI